MRPGSRKTGKNSAVRNTFFILSSLYIGALIFAAVAAPLAAPENPTEQFLEKRLLPPLSKGNPLGTDEFGRDVLSRLIYGARPLLIVGSLSVLLALSLGLLLGILAGLGGRLVGSLIMLLTDSILSFPTVLLAITVVSLFGYGPVQIVTSIGIVFSPVFCRLVRAETKSLLTEGFVESSRALGTRRLKIVTRHILPNMQGSLIVQSTTIFALAIIVEASLSFLGLGTQPPQPAWGLMLKDARDYLFTAPHLAFAPGTALAATVFSCNFIGDVLAERLNPKLSRF